MLGTAQDIFVLGVTFPLIEGDPTYFDQNSRSPSCFR